MVESGKTIYYNNEMFNCDNLEDFKKEIYSNLESQKDRWVKKIKEILDENKYSQADLARLCDVSRATVLKWVRGSFPQSRDMFIRIGFAAHYDLNEMNRFLQRYGHYPELYPKNPEDSVIIFVLNSKIIEHSYASCKSVFENIEKELKGKRASAGNDVKTETVMNRLLNISELSELMEFFEKNSEMFDSSFNKFYAYVKDFVRKNNGSYIDDYNADNVNILADTLGWSSSLRKCIYLIYRKEWFPRRSKVISMGIHLNMKLEEINEMLMLSKMEPLYVINPMEAVLIYALMDAELSDEIYEGTDDLYNHVINIMEELGLDTEEID